MKKRLRRTPSSTKINVPLAKTPFLTMLVFIFGFGAGYLYYEGQLPIVFSSESETPKLNVCFSPKGQCEKLALFAIKGFFHRTRTMGFSCDLIIYNAASFKDGTSFTMASTRKPR